MDELDRKRRKMDREGGSVKSDDDKPKPDDARVDQKNLAKIPKGSEIANLAANKFKDVRTKLTFVDKSECIKNFFECASIVVQITAPRRFGKTTYMDMLKIFSVITVNEDGLPISNPADSENYKLFEGLQLGLNDPEFVKKHCGQYPVIHMSLKDVGGTTNEEILDTLKDALLEAFEQHSYLVEEAADGSHRFKKKIKGIETFLNYWDDGRQHRLSKKDVIKGLKFLSKVLHAHFEKEVLVLIDETDSPIMEAINENVNDETLRYLMRCIKKIMSVTLKDNDFIARALLNSCVRLSGVFSYELNNQYLGRFLQSDSFDTVYGFTTEAVKGLFQKDEFKTVEDIDGIEKWYGGYQILDNTSTRIYSSWSIINYLHISVPKQKKMFDSYWARTGFVNTLGKLFVKPEIQKRIDELIKVGSITIVEDEPTVDNILKLKETICGQHNKLEESEVDFFLQLLWDDGLLNAVRRDGKKITLMIPNWEIKSEIQRNCYSHSLFATKCKIKPTNIDRYVQALKKLLLITESDDEECEEDEGEEVECLKEECEEAESEKEECEEAENEKEECGVEESEKQECDGKSKNREEALHEVVNAVATLFSDGAVVPCNESELHHVLYYLAYSTTIFDTQSNRAVVTKSSEEGQVNTNKKLPRRKAKGSRQKKQAEKRGRKNEFDLCVIIVGTAGVIFELKYCKKDATDKSASALKQIIDKQYYKIFDKEEYKDVRTKIYVGLCFRENLNVTVHYLVNTVDVSKAKCLENTAAGTTKADTDTVLE